MTTEETIAARLIEAFRSLENKITIRRKRRIFAQLDRQDLKNLLLYAFAELDFVILCTITGLDEGQNLGFIYHIARPDGIILISR